MASSCNPRDRRRSERVVLRMRITVIAEDHARERRQFDAMTQVVNAHGGLMRIETELHVGQPMLLRSEEHTSELQSHSDLVCRLLLEKKKKKKKKKNTKNK